MNESNAGRPRQRARTHRIFAARAICAGFLALAGLAVIAGSVSYTYDALGRLATVIYNNGTTTTTINYSYDAAGNRTSVATTSP